MKLNKSFVGINYFQTPEIQKTLIENLMDPSLLEPFRLLANWTEEDIRLRRQRLERLHSNSEHRLFMVTKSVQEHSELIRFEKIKLGWFRNVKSQSSTYILSKNEFFRFVVEKGKEIYVLHFYCDPNISEDSHRRLIESGYPHAEFYGYKYDTFIIYIDEHKYPDGFIPDNQVWGQDPINKQRFLKLMLFIELSEPEIKVLKNNEKLKSGSVGLNHEEKKIKNDSGVDVTIVNTSWNKIIVSDNAFTVRGHIRIQPYGPNRSLYKPIWIDEYEKSGYTRGLPHIKEQDH